MKNTNLRKQAQEVLDKYKNDSQYPTCVSYTMRFVEYCETLDKDVKDFTTEDFETFLKPYTNPHTLTIVKSKISIFLNYCGYTDADNELRKIKQIVPDLNYLLSFDDLKSGIDDARNNSGIKEIINSQYKDLEPMLCNPLVCDKYTLGEVILYLAWIGVPRDTLVKLPLSAINMEKLCVEYEDSDVHREFSFADNPIMVDVFGKYSKAKHFAGMRWKNSKLSFINGDYYGDGIIRLSTFPKSGSNSPEIIKSFLNRIFSNYFPFAVDYKNVYFSGAFSRGFEKIMQGDLPIFTPEGIRDFFGIIAETEATKFSVKRQWENYLAWRQSAEGNALDIDIETLRRIKMKSIAVNCIASLKEFPEDDNAKIRTTAKELDDLMMAIYNLGRNDPK